jgi:hypothetical protein
MDTSILGKQIAAITAAQEAMDRSYDNRLPDDDDGMEDYINEQVGMILSCEDSLRVKFFDFAEQAEEALFAKSVEMRNCYLTQLFLAVRRGDFALAENLAMQFEDTIVSLAEKLVIKKMERESGDDLSKKFKEQVA